MIGQWVRQPLFLVGLVLRLMLIALLPLAGTALGPGLWAPLDSSGALNFVGFPGGLVLHVAVVPFVTLSQAMGWGESRGLLVALLAADLAMLAALRCLLDLRPAMLLKLYWLSPILLYLTYCAATVELISASLLCWTLVCVRWNKPIWAGAACVGAISAHFAAMLAAPLLAIYYFRNRNLRPELKPLAMGVGASICVLGAGELVAKSVDLADLAADPLFQCLHAISIGLESPSGRVAVIYLFPLAYILSLFIVWRLRRIAFDVFVVFFGLIFMVALLLSGGASVWLIWMVPVFTLYQAESGRVATVLSTALAAACVMAGVDGTGPLAQTMAVALGIVVFASICRYTIYTNDQLRLSRRPLVIGIAGDSGAGKDTLVDSLASLFDEQSVVKLSGDDYHFWDRHKPMWQVMTHLNPRANDLEKFARDLVTLTDGKGIVSPHYDHASGRKSKPVQVRSNDFIIASGLHCLYLPILRECYDLSIYLDIDDDLRKYFKLQRDVKQRGHSPERVLAAIADRESDAAQFVRPQRDQADLVLSLRPVNPRLLEGPKDPAILRLKLVARSRQGFHEESLIRALVGVCGLHVDMALSEEGALVVLTIEGETQADDIAFAARTLVPHILPLLRSKPAWEDGITGLMQLVVLAHLDQALRRRLI